MLTEQRNIGFGCCIADSCPGLTAFSSLTGEPLLFYVHRPSANIPKRSRTSLWRISWKNHERCSPPANIPAPCAPHIPSSQHSSPMHANTHTNTTANTPTSIVPPSLHQSYTQLINPNPNPNPSSGPDPTPDPDPNPNPDHPKGEV